MRVADFTAETMPAEMAKRGLVVDPVSGQNAGGLAIAAVDSSGRVVGWNAAMAVLTGVPLDEAVGRRTPELFTLADEDGMALSPTAEFGGAAWLGTRDRRAVPVEVSCAGVGPTPEGTTLIAVSAAESAARRLNQLWELLLACLNHELHGPLTVIHGHAQLLEASVTDPAAPESLAAIREAVQTMRHIIKDLALITGDGPPPDTAEIDARSLLREVIRDLPSLKTRTVVEESSRTVLRGDRRRLRQCLLIVLSNADKYAPEGTITVTLDGEGDWGVIAVSDQGPGIPESERASVLGPYGRSTTILDRPGKGLGLYIANVLMASMSGRIGLMSAPAGGLRAELRLPLAPARHASREKGGRTGAADCPRKTGYPRILYRTVPDGFANLTAC